MTFNELADFARSKNPTEQVVIALQENQSPPDEILDEVGKVCYYPFVATTLKERTYKIKGEMQHMPKSSRLYVELWDDEKARTKEQPYTWQQLIDWINELENANIEATALAAWHLCKLKILSCGSLYGLEE